MPGPADYAPEIISPKSVTDDKEEMCQFGSNTVRFKDVDQKSHIPGPGAYENFIKVPKVKSKGSSMFLKEW